MLGERSSASGGMLRARSVEDDAAVGWMHCALGGDPRRATAGGAQSRQLYIEAPLSQKVPLAGLQSEVAPRSVGLRCALPGFWCLA
jgi:hypothetical protein